MNGAWSTLAFQFYCMTRDRLVHEMSRELHSFWPNVVRALRYGKIQSTIYPHTVWLDQHFTLCVYQVVSVYWFYELFYDGNRVLTNFVPFADHTKVIGFSFDSNEAAHEIWTAIERLISDPENISLSVPGRKRKQQKRPKPAPLPQKSQISQPCQFSHVTSVTTNDTHRYFSLQAFVGQSLNHREP